MLRLGIMAPAILLVAMLSTWARADLIKRSAREMTSKFMEQRCAVECSSFTNDVKAYVQQAMLDGSLVRNGPPVFVTKIVERYIPCGATFDKAETLLRDAGLEVSGRPGESSKGQYNDKYDVYALSKSLIVPQGLGSSINFVVTLRPTTLDYGSVQSATAYVMIEDF